MNKTVNINLGGMFFHIDEDAYQKLTRYFDAIKRSLSNTSGQDEIIKDIEMRIAELISEKHSNDKQVINIKELDEIIAVMGQPEDYRIEDETAENQPQANNQNTRTKKLYRDKEKGMIGGVASGLGYYFGIDAVWIRIVLILLVFAGFGTGILAYLILWIVTPEAVTTSEKLEMTGEPVTISNIEKKVRAEFDSVSDKFKNGYYDKMGNQVKTNSERIAANLGAILMTIFKVFAKVLGVILIMSGMATLIVFLVGSLTLGSTNFTDFPFHDFIESGNFTDYPIWFFGILVFIAIGIPNFFLMLLGFKLVSPNMKSIGTIAKYSLLALWIIAIGILISIGIKQATEFAFEGRVIQKTNIPLKETDTLFIKFKHNDYFAKNINDHHDFMITEDSTNTKIIFSNEVRITLLKTDEKMPYLQIEKQAKGKSLSEAKKTAEKINYGFKIEGNQLILDNYLLTDFKNKFRNQEVELFLYLPVGTLLRPDASIEDYDRSDDSFFNLHYSADNFLYRVEKNQVKCLNCPAEENEWNDVKEDEEDSTSTSVILNKEGILIKEKNRLDETQKANSVKINKDGITIKTN